jgi:hypothetical protein
MTLSVKHRIPETQCVESVYNRNSCIQMQVRLVPSSNPTTCISEYLAQEKNTLKKSKEIRIINISETMGYEKSLLVVTIVDGEYCR